jgi:hypothetical protein
MLEAAATALFLTETGAITTRGSLGHLLAVQPHRPVGHGNPHYAEPADSWRKAMDAMTQAIREAQENPATARQLLTLLTYGCPTPDRFDSRRRDLIAIGVSERHLPSLGRP